MRNEKKRGPAPGTPKVPGSGIKKGGTMRHLKEGEMEMMTKEAIRLMTEELMIPTTLLRTIVQKFDLSEWNARKVIDAANDWIIEFYKSDKEKTIEKAIQRLYDLHERCLKEKDFSTAAKVLKDINQLTRLHVDRIEVEGSLTIPSTINITVSRGKDAE